MISLARRVFASERRLASRIANSVNVTIESNAIAGCNRSSVVNWGLSIWQPVFIPL
jgi:hypothetical protein